jgi:hypothetical protein
MARELPDYLSFLLRLWRVDERGLPNWRASLQSPQTGERVSFATLDALFAFLREQTGVTDAQPGAGTGDDKGWSGDRA